MGIVYWIHCNETGENYIGSTTQSLGKRICDHRSHAVNSGGGARPILERKNYNVSILEDNIEKDILKVREQFYMDCCDNLINIQRAVACRDKRIEQQREYAKEYYIKNREKKKLQNKQYREKKKSSH